MATYNSAPKQRILTENEDITSYEAWRQNLLFTLTLQPKFVPYLKDGVTWGKKTTASPNRGFVDDGEGDIRQTAAEKTAVLELMLGQIANFCPISRSLIVKKSTCLNDVWQQIRQYYGLHSTGSQFLSLSSIKLKTDERPEALYQRLYSFFEDNLLTTSCGITHNGDAVEADEEMTPIIENTITWLWLKLLHAALPDLVRQKYGAELRNKSLHSLKNEISQALPSLLDEIQSIEEPRVFRVPSGHTGRSYGRPFNAKFNNQKPSSKSCVLCKTAGRSHTHWLSECRFLPDDDKRALARARAIQNVVDTPTDPSVEHFNPPEADEEVLPELPTYAYSVITHKAPDYSIRLDCSAARRVSSVPSGILDCAYNGKKVCITIDSGATSNMIKAEFVHHLGISVVPSTQLASQADGRTPLTVIGEVHTQFTLGHHVFIFDALVIEELDVDILGGMSFMSVNDIAIRPANSTLIIKWKEVIHYRKIQPSFAATKVRRTFVLRGPDQRTVLLPGDTLALKTPQDTEDGSHWAIEPRSDNNVSCSWITPQETEVINRTVILVNSSAEPVVVDKHAHVCQVQPVVNTADIGSEGCDTPPIMSTAPKFINNVPFSASVSVDPDNIVSTSIKQQIHVINRKYDKVFDPTIPMYNGRSGNIVGNVNMGRVLPPQRKGRLPQYNNDKMISLQNRMDELEAVGVFAKPEDVGVTVEYLNMSFLTAKPNGGDRLVTSFGEVGQYSKPQPSLMPNVNDTLRVIGQWKYLIKTDLSKAFYQIPLNKDSMRFCGVSTPFRGVRVYTRCAMGMPGSETALEELMNRVVGHLVQEGVLAKIADDMYCGGDTPEETLATWSKVLECLADNNLGLSASKTIIFPKSTVTLGWIWCEGTLKASPHRMAALSTVEPPSTVRSLKSFIGAYKVLSRVLKRYAEIMYPLEQTVAGKQSSDSIVWTDELRGHFKRAQESLSHCQVITIPRASDCLWIVTDGAVTCGIASTLYLMRNGQRKLGGFFNAQLRKNQTVWLPCEVEALSICMAIIHFSPYIVQSNEQSHLVTDNKPCVQAYQRMCRGQFSNSSRVTAFISTVARYQVTISHTSGVNIPLTDFNSRNPVDCHDSSCQICKFVEETRNSVIRAISVQEVLSGKCAMPFINRPAWLASQRECPHLRRVHAHLHQGTRPSKKMTKVREVKRYLQVAVIARDGLLVVRENIPFQGTCERIIVPVSLIHGLLTALHIQFDHPTSYQLKRLCERYYFAINLDKFASEVTDACDVCSSLKSIPHHMINQSSSDPPMGIGVSFAVDVMKRSKQLVLVMRETVSSYTSTMFVTDEGKNALRSGIICLASVMAGRGKSVRIDPGPGLASLVGDPELLANRITLELGRIKNPNKNPVAERCVLELGLEILKLNPHGDAISGQTLALATSNMNARVRRDGLSSYEIWTQRDQFTGKQLPICDQDIISSQTQSRIQNHTHSAKSKARGRSELPKCDISEGSLVYVISDKDKTKARDKYIVVSKDGEWCRIRKFTKNQYRSKPYDVKLSEVYPITHSVLDSSRVGAALEGSSDSDDEPFDESSANGHPSLVDPDRHNESSSNESDPDEARPQRENSRKPPLFYYESDPE